MCLCVDEMEQRPYTMELMESQVELMIDLSSSILDSALRMRNILEPRQNYWNDVMTTPEEINERRHEALQRYRAKYFDAGVEAEVFRAEVDQKQEQQQQEQEQKSELSVESWHTVYPKRRLEFELQHGIIKEEELDVTPPVEDEIDLYTELQPPNKRQKLA